MSSGAINPIHQFEIHNAFVLKFLNKEILHFTNMQMTFILISFIIFIFGLFFKNYSKIIPSKLQTLLEYFISSVDDILNKSLDKKALQYKPFVFSLFVFILLSNILGLLPYSFTSTSHISVTLTLALMVFILTLFILIFRHKLFFFKIFIPKGTPLWLAPLIFILEFFSFFIRPVSLSIRLSANMIAGHVLLEVLAFFVIMMKIFGFLPFFVLIVMFGFELFVAFLQSYIFTIFTCVYINEALHH